MNNLNHLFEEVLKESANQQRINNEPTDPKMANACRVTFARFDNLLSSLHKCYLYSTDLLETGIKASEKILDEDTIKEIERVYNFNNDASKILRQLYNKETQKFGGVKSWHNQWN